MLCSAIGLFQEAVFILIPRCVDSRSRLVKNRFHIHKDARMMGLVPSAPLNDEMYSGLSVTDVSRNLIIASNYTEFAPIFMGVRYNLLDDGDTKEQIKAIHETEIADMSVYPAASSIRVFDGVVVIKLENDQE